VRRWFVSAARSVRGRRLLKRTKTVPWVLGLHRGSLRTFLRCPDLGRSDADGGRRARPADRSRLAWCSFERKVACAGTCVGMAWGWRTPACLAASGRPYTSSTVERTSTPASKGTTGHLEGCFCQSASRFSAGRRQHGASLAGRSGTAQSLHYWRAELMPAGHTRPYRQARSCIRPDEVAIR